ncbi:MAG: nicotinate (nicotinamide) nucleotide adenylyltransferase [Myxococcota bacterium]|jgi:nicotinate (nicotinamide) nucleotide adenylyltransferase
MRVAVFGGSFNPPHVGHALVAGWLRWSETADEVWLVPCAAHPLGKRGLAPFTDRVRWCRALAESVGPWVRVECMEQQLGHPSYTINTLDALRTRHPDALLRLVVGSDILDETHLWRAWDRIESDYAPIVVSRAGHRAVQGGVSFPEVSSTAIRRALGRGESADGLLPAVERLAANAFCGAPMRRSTALSRLPGVAHGFTDRRGARGGHELDLGPRPTGEARRVAWADALRGVDAAMSLERVALLDQVHGSEVLVDPEPCGVHTTVGVGDAIVCTRVGVTVAVRTADCVPILAACPGGVAAVHAGWRGVAAGVVHRAVSALCAATGAEPSQVSAAIGPHISAAQYEVGSEVIAAIVESGVPRHVVARPGPRRAHADVGAAVAFQLEAAGVGAVDWVPGCTASDSALHSFRRDGAASGRQAALIGRVQ